MFYLFQITSLLVAGLRCCFVAFFGFFKLAVSRCRLRFAGFLDGFKFRVRQHPPIGLGFGVRRLLGLAVTQVAHNTCARAANPITKGRAFNKMLVYQTANTPPGSTCRANSAQLGKTGKPQATASAA